MMINPAPIDKRTDISAFPAPESSSSWFVELFLLLLPGLLLGSRFSAILALSPYVSHQIGR